MRILQIIQRNQLRGAEIFACQLCTELLRMGFHAEVAVLFGDDTGMLEYPVAFHHLNVDEKAGWMDLKGYKQLNDFIRNGKFEIVQANAGDTLRYAALSKLIYGWKPRLVFRNANKASDFLRHPLKKWVYRQLLKKADAVASVSRECLIDIISLFPFLASKVYELPIGVHIYSSTVDNSLINSSVPGGPVFLHAGSFVFEKNHSGVIRIFAALRRKYPQARLLLAGTGPLKESIRSLVSNSGLSSSVEFLGATKELRNFMHTADIFILPSLIEGLPAVILESFAARLPVVAYDTGGISEVVMNGKTGRIVEKNDEAAFVKAVSELLELDNDFIRENAFRMITEKYTNEKVANAFSDAYKRIIQS